MQGRWNVADVVNNLHPGRGGPMAEKQDTAYLKSRDRA